MFLIRASWSPDKVCPEIRVPCTCLQGRSSIHHQARVPHIICHFSPHLSLSKFITCHLVKRMLGRCVRVCMCVFLSVVLWCVCVCVCVLTMEILYAISVYIIGRVLTEKLTVNQLVRFVLNVRYLSENKTDRQSTVTRGEVALVLLYIDCCQGE
jgi:phage terminase large subunit-like protein